MSPYTIVLRKIDSCSCKKAARKSEKTVGKTAVVKAGAYIVSIDKKTTVYKLEACEILETCALAAHSNAFLYFTDLLVSSSLNSDYCTKVVYRGLALYHTKVWSPAVLPLRRYIAEKQPVAMDKIASNLNSKVPGFRSPGHIYIYCNVSPVNSRKITVLSDITKFCHIWIRYETFEQE